MFEKLFGGNRDKTPPKQTMWDGTEIRGRDPITPPPPPKETSVDYLKDVIMPMVFEKEKEVLAAQPSNHAAYTESLAERVEGFTFSCIRHGDFLTIFMTQEATSTAGKYSTTINLRSVKTIRLISGKAPSFDANLQYYLMMINKDGNSFSWTSAQYPIIAPPPEGYKHEVVTLGSDYIKPGRFVSPPKEDCGSGGSQYMSHRYHNPVQDKIPHTTKNIAMDSVDDALAFEGIDFRIYSPFGTGKMVETKVLEALEKGYTPNPLPSVIVQEG